jgi:HEAT repeat protein
MSSKSKRADRQILRRRRRRRRRSTVNVYGKIIGALVLAVCLASIPASASGYDLLRDALQRDDWKARLLNKAALDKLNEPASIEALIGLIANKQIEWRIQIRGIRVLSEIHTPRVQDALVELFNDLFFHLGCPAVKSSLALALGNFKGPRVVGALLGGLDDPELLVREASIDSLGRVGDIKAVPFLIAELKDRHFGIRESSIRSLGLLRDARAVPLLKEIAETDEEPLLRNEARSALSLIRGWCAPACGDDLSRQAEPPSLRGGQGLRGCNTEK